MTEANSRIDEEQKQSNQQEKSHMDIKTELNLKQICEAGVYADAGGETQFKTVTEDAANKMEVLENVQVFDGRGIKMEKSETDSEFDVQKDREEVENKQEDAQISAVEKPNNVKAVKMEVDEVIANSEGLQEHVEKDSAEFISNRVQLLNLPAFFSYKQTKNFLAKNVNGVSARKIKWCRKKAFFSFSNVEDAASAIAQLNELEIKGKKLLAKYARPEPVKRRDCSLNNANDEEEEEDLETIARSSVTPLADLPYDEQLSQKFVQSEKLLTDLIKKLDSANVTSFKPKLLKQHLEPILPSPRIVGYRNKCEFTVGETVNGILEVGFVRGKFTENQHYIVPIGCCSNISDQMKRIVEYFKEFIAETGYQPFNEFKREGVWRMLTIREFGCDVMIIATVFPMKEKKDEEILKKNFSEKFLCNLNFAEKHFRVTSVYWQRLENASDEVVYEHIGAALGARYVYETILGTRFRISPGAFFQTNTAAAEVLYSTIVEKCMSSERGYVDFNDALKADSAIKTFQKSDDLLDDSSIEPDQKKTKLTCLEGRKNTLFLDICCGTGTIGICILNSLKRRKMDANAFLLGVELVETAVKDAIRNAHDNLLFEKQCCFIAGEASDIFQNISSHLPPGMHLEDSKIIGILDPPRGGVHDKVILGCRMLSGLEHLIYVSCHPLMASKNLTDLCRPTSKKFVGKPFRIESIVPVDLFPQTIHCEWVIKLCR